MKLFIIFSRKYLLIFLIAFTVPFFLSCNFSKNGGAQIGVVDAENEDRAIAAFLVKVTEINSAIRKLSQVAQLHSKSVEVKDAFIEQVKLSTEIQKKVQMIAAERLVTTPLTAKRLSVRYTNDVTLMDLLINELISETMVLEQITDVSDDTKIFQLKNEFLPKLNFQSQKISSLKIKYIVTK